MSSNAYLFFDTETSGIPRNYKAPVTDLANWPRMVQLAWVLTDAQGNDITSAEHIVKPDGYTIPNAAAKIHGITTAIALRDGVELSIALDAMNDDLRQATTLIAHNMAFDEKILGEEFLRAGRKNAVASKPRLCTMQSSTHFCQLPGPYGFKWPSLQELYTKLFNEKFDGAHRAMTDVRACARCYFELKRRGVMA